MKGCLDDFGTYTGMMSALLMSAQQAKREFKSLPQAEQERILLERERKAEQHRIMTSIQACRCPECSSKLVRGRKDKKNDYKRLWACIECQKEYLL